MRWLSRFSYKGFFQDPDALWNGLLYNLPRTRVSANGAFWTSRGLDTGSKIKVRFANGTTREYGNTATSTADFTGVTGGKTFYEKFCSGPSTASLVENAKQKHSRFLTAAPSSELPSAARSNRDSEPIRESTDGAVAGYFLEGDHSNVAVLSLRNFVGAAQNEDPLWEYS